MPGRAGSWLAGIALAAAGALLALLLVEGALALWHFERPAPSLTWRLAQLLRGAGEAGVGKPVLVDASEIEALLPALSRDAVGLGNSPFEKLISDAAAFNQRDAGCLRMKPDLDKTATFLRTRLYDRFNPPLAFWDTQRALGPEVAAFVDRYGMRRVRLRSNAQGERLTLPESERSELGFVAGDSVALGIGLMDDETLASRLEALDPSVAWVNLGVGGAEAADVICNLEAARQRHPGKLTRLVYVYCENDLRDDEPYGRPEQVIEWLGGVARDEGLREPTVVYAPYLFNVFPELTRIPGQRGWDHPSRAAERERLRELTQQAGFRWLDIGALAREESARDPSRFAGLALFLDSVHLSPRGTQLLAESITSRVR